MGIKPTAKLKCMCKLAQSFLGQKKALGMTEYKSIAVVGAGSVGPLQALFLAQAGFEMHAYEKTNDFRGIQ